MGDAMTWGVWWVKHFSILAGDVAVGEVGVVINADVAVTGAGEGGEVANMLRLVTRDVADAVAFAGDNDNGLRVIGIVWLGFQGGDGFSEVFVDVLTVSDAGNGELKVVAYALILGPHTDVVAFITQTEVIETLDCGHCWLCLNWVAVAAQ